MYSWEELNYFVSHCERCGLCKERNLPVMGRGDLKTPIMFIAEAPGQQEDLEGIPFVGPAGQLFVQMLAEIGLKKSDVYITNVVKCRPPGNRNPSPKEQDACLSYLRHETLLIRPKIIVCLGRIAAQKIIDPQFKISRQCGEWFQRKGYLLTACYHPSALLRFPENLPEARKQFQMIRQKLDELK